MGLHHLPAQSLPREKLLTRGAASLSDAELLAIVLRTGTAGRNVLLMAQDVLDHLIVAQGHAVSLAQRGLMPLV